MLLSHGWRWQVFELQSALLAQGTPELLFERNVGESIRSLECGIVNTAVSSQPASQRTAHTTPSSIAEPLSAAARASGLCLER